MLLIGPCGSVDMESTVASASPARKLCAFGGRIMSRRNDGLGGSVSRRVFVFGAALLSLVAWSPKLSAQDGGPEPIALVPPDGEMVFFRGLEQPPDDWHQIDFDDGDWEAGSLGIGYEASGDPVAEPLLNTLLPDMQDAYASVYVRASFELEDLESIQAVQFGIQYDDGYVAYLNGEEIARVGLTGNPPLFDALAASKDITAAPEFTTIDVSKLVAGTNVLAVQGHNTTLGSSDFSCVPRLLAFDSVCPQNLLCDVRGTSSIRVRLRWANPITPAPFDEVQIFRNDEFIGSPSLPATRLYNDRDPPPGEHTYRVVAIVGGEPCSGEDEITCTVTVPSVGTPFRRGDADGVGQVDLTDGVFLLNFLFLNGPAPPCFDAADVNDDGELNITTGVFLFNFLFVSGPIPPEPGSMACGIDETADDIDCATYDNCG